MVWRCKNYGIGNDVSNQREVGVASRLANAGNGGSRHGLGSKCYNVSSYGGMWAWLCATKCGCGRGLGSSEVGNM